MVAVNVMGYLAALALVLAVWSTDVRAQGPQAGIPSGVTLVDVEWRDAADKHKPSRGTGWVIGHVEKTLYIVTAGHTVIDQASLRAASDIRVKPIGCLEPLPATPLLSSYDPALDVIVLQSRLSGACLTALSTADVPPVALGSIAKSMQRQIGLALTLSARSEADGIDSTRAELAGWSHGSLLISPAMDPGMSGGLVSSETGLLLGMIRTTREATDMTTLLAHLKDCSVPVDFVGASSWLLFEGHPANATLAVDSGPTVPMHGKWRVSVGGHKLEVRAHGYDQPKPLMVSPAAGEFLTVCGRWEQPISPFWRDIRFPVLGTSIALLVAGAVTGGLALKMHADFNRAPTRSSYETTNTLNTATDVLLLAGGATMLAFGAGSLALNANSRSALSLDCN